MKNNLKYIFYLCIVSNYDLFLITKANNLLIYKGNLMFVCWYRPRRLSLKVLKRRLSWTRSSSVKSSGGIDGHLTELADSLTIEENETVTSLDQEITLGKYHMCLRFT